MTAMKDPKARSDFWTRMAEVHPRRSLTLFACGTALGLGIAAYGLFTAAGTRTYGVPAEDVALVNGRHILRSDFVAQTELETTKTFDQTTKEERLKVLNEMIAEELLVQRGLEMDLAASDAEVRAAQVGGVQAQVDADVLAQQPSDEQLRSYFDAHRDKYAAEGIMALRDFVIQPDETVSADEAMTKAKEAAEAFRKGRDSEDVLATFGLKDSGRIDRGDLFDFAVRVKLSPALYGAAAKLATHQASEPIMEAGAVHVLMMEKRQAPPSKTFEETRDAVLQDFRKDEQTRVEDGNLKYLLNKADVQLAPEFR
jgi:parvulin-like peptidyl-prolyl isomerase